MKVVVFSAKSYDRTFLETANAEHNHELVFLEAQPNEHTAPLAAGFPGVGIFVNDKADAKTLEILAKNGTRLLALRSIGFNHIDLKAAARFGIKTVRVPTIAENTIATISTLEQGYICPNEIK